MNKKRTKFTSTIIIHVTIWVAWFITQSLKAIVAWQPLPFWPVAWNYIGLVLVFYSSLVIGRSYCSSTSFIKGLSLGGRSRAMYLIFRPQILFFFLVPIAYITTSWLLDKYFFATGQRSGLIADFFYYADSRFTRCSIYWITGLSLAFVLYFFRKKNHLLQMHRQREAMMKQYIDNNIKKSDDRLIKMENDLLKFTGKK
jgi:hypothetical protein